jgi:ATP-binding cassette subfamily B protein
MDIHFKARHPWRTLANLYRPERRRLWLAVLFNLVKVMPVWVLPVVTANIVDVLARPGPEALPRLWLNAAIGGLAILQNVFTASLYVRYLSGAVRNVEVRVRSALVRRLQMLSLGYLGRQDTATLQTKLLRDIESMEQMSRQLFESGLFAVASVIVALAVTAVRAPVFVPVLVVFIPLVALSRRLIAGRLQRRNETLRREIEGMNASVLGMLNMIPVTRAHAAEDEEISRAENRFESVRSAAFSLDNAAGTLGAAAWVVLMLVNFSGLVTAAWLAYRGIVPLTPGDLVLLAGYFTAIMTAVLQLNALLPVVTRGCDALQSIGEVLECPDMEENRGKRAVARVRGRFDFERIGFTYQADSGAAPALTDISFSVQPGETVGIVGPSGSGKSTLASLLTGFHRPTSGRLLLDGQDITEIDLRTFRRQLAVVSQQTILFHGTLRENIVYGAREVSAAMLAAALESANVAEFIDQLPQGPDTLIGPAGVQLSGGQRQRIAIARALLREPRVLILDEATSALDAASEGVVQQALERLAAGRTTFVIAHRLSVMRRVDRVVVLERGRIVESGIPAELLARPQSFFARMHGLTVAKPA